VGGLGARLSAKGAHWLLIGRRPDKEQLAKWRKPTADGDPGANAGGPSDGGDGGSGGSGPRRPSSPHDRYRNEQGQVIDRNTGQVLHDQNSDRTLLSTRAHNRLVRFRGYRILHRGGRAAYGATVGLPAGVRRARSGGSRYSQDARQQVRVWGNTVREDGRAWSDTGRHVARVLREHTDDSGGPGPFASRRLPTAATAAAAATPRPAAPARPAPSGRPSGRPAPAPTRPTASAGGPAASPPPAPLPRREGPLLPPQPDLGRPVLPGGGSARNRARDEARARMQELMRRTAPEAERLRQERAQRRNEDGDDE
jgi:hypothetical protein